MRNPFKDLSLVLLLAAFTFCSLQEQSLEQNPPGRELIPMLPNTADPQIAEYIRNILQDKNGDLWLGTNGYGVAHYDGDSVSYYSNPQGFAGQQITGITEDRDKNIWFSTDQGVVKFDWTNNSEGNKQFT
ncbi:MAG: hypothetical protein KDC80_08965, partial [Saprospiraceae bacterium]|nr:hypothetical protein [Saprospiraceae bacterium]